MKDHHPYWGKRFVRFDQYFRVKMAPCSWCNLTLTGGHQLVLLTSTAAPINGLCSRETRAFALAKVPFLPIFVPSPSGKMFTIIRFQMILDGCSMVIHLFPRILKCICKTLSQPLKKWMVPSETPALFKPCDCASISGNAKRKTC